MMAIALALVVGACGDGAEKSLVGADVVGADTADVGATNDVAAGEVAAAEDVARTEVSTLPDVVAVQCPNVPSIGDSVTFTQVPRTFPAPALVGNFQGASDPNGDWRLADVTFFQAGTFVDWVTVEFTNGGKTSGNATLTGDKVFGVHMFVDMRVHVTVGENEGEDGATATIEIGGPTNVDGGFLRGDFTQCGAGMAEGGEIPSELAFDHDGTRLRIAVVLSREAIIQLLPADQRENASFVVTGPLTVVARFER